MSEPARPSPWSARYFLLTALIPGHLANWAVEWGFAALTTALGAVLYPRFHRRYPAVSTYGLLTVAAITLVSGVSYVVTLLGGRFPTGARDWTDLARPFMVYFSCTLGLSFGAIPLVRMRRLCAYVLLVSVCVAATLVVDVPGLSGLSQTIYGSTKTVLSSTLIRLSVPFENPNFLGLFAVTALSCALLFGVRPDYGTAALALIAIALTGSRTAWLTSAVVVLTFVGTVVVLPLAGWRSTRGSRLAPATAAVIVTLIGARYLPAVWESNQRFLDFLAGLATLELLRDPSYVERQQMRAQAFTLISERLAIGWGALKQGDIDIVDNQYVSLLLRSGLTGALILVGAVWGLFRMHLRAAAAQRTRLHVVMLWLITFAWLWSGSFAENVRLAVLTTMLFVSTAHGHDQRHA
jgi:hypothetical protein